jgi:hypothetical protein
MKGLFERRDGSSGEPASELPCARCRDRGESGAGRLLFSGTCADGSIEWAVLRMFSMVRAERRPRTRAGAVRLAGRSCAVAGWKAQPTPGAPLEATRVGWD